MTEFKIGTCVVCKRGDIDRNRFANEHGVIEAFARLSSFHPREACVRTKNGAAWFWLSDLTKIDRS